uniref:Uncharacterized protein n=1 Tax=Ciona intestinalis TaxID=7719 RepID=H2XRK0_CIOIN
MITGCHGFNGSNYPFIFQTLISIGHTMDYENLND